MKDGRWEEVRIEFEFESRNFKLHQHDPDGCDMIVCWKHNWPECPEHIEVVELPRIIEIERMEGNDDHEEDAVDTALTPKEKKLSNWNQFCKEKRLEGVPFKRSLGYGKSRKTQPDECLAYRRKN